MDNQKHVIASGLLLAFSALLGTGLLSLAHEHAAPYVAENEYRQLLNSLGAVIPDDQYDNDLLQDTIQLSQPELLGIQSPVTVYRARLKGEAKAVAFNVRALDGYSGPIDLLIGVYVDGSIAGVRVIRHKETPGLGDAIEAHKSPWIKSFDGRSRRKPQAQLWKVQRDGGVFDQITGATITSRAVIKGVHKALEFYHLRKDEIFSQRKPMEKSG